MPPAATRSYDMGFAPIPTQPVTPQAWIDTFALLGTSADVVLHHSAPDWAAFVSGTDATGTPGIASADFITGMAALNGLRTFIVIDPLRSDRTAIDSNLPASVGTDFADPEVRQAFKNYSIRIARDYTPAYLALGSEVNTYMTAQPADAANLRSLIEETIPLVRGESPASVVTVTFQFEGLNGTATGTAQWAAVTGLEASLDAVAITTYPSPWFATPDDLPSSYYAQIADYTSKPVIIAESGWPTAGDLSYHGSPANQRRFIERMDALTSALDLRLWIWWFLHDWDGPEYGAFFQTMGLRASDGGVKESWASWLDLVQRPRE